MSRSQRPQLQPFLAIYAMGSSLEDMQAFTPRVMRWSVDDMWILDLRPCQSFWMARSRSLNLDATALFRRLLQRQFSRRQDDEIGIGVDVGYQAVLAVNPWQAVLGLTYVRERNLSGLVLGDSIYRESSWCAWWRAVDVIAEHFLESQRKYFSIPTFRGQCVQMSRAIKRLGIASPFDLHQADSLAIGRRFGAVLRDLWQWTWGAKSSDISSQSTEDDFFQMGFPWKTMLSQEIPMVTRHLEAPLLEWEFIEPLLQEDLNRICNLDSWDARERVVRLEWKIVSHDMSVLDIPICFRHPHCLASERNSNFTTTTLQAYYSFCEVLKNAIDRQNNDRPPIISWTLAITERLRLSDEVRDIFGECESGVSQLMDVENRLPIPLISYDICHDWIPENSYCIERNADQRSFEDKNRGQASFSALGAVRPLFLYSKPIIFNSRGASVAWRFLERIVTKWWKLANRQSIQRDYYKLVGPDRRSMWAYKDITGNWYIHGIFA